MILMPAAVFAGLFGTPLVARFSSFRAAFALALAVLTTAFADYRNVGPPARVDSSIRSHLKNVATALEMYGVDHHAFTPRVELLEPDYLKDVRDKPPLPYSYAVTRSGDRFTLQYQGRMRSREGDGPWTIQERGLVEVSGELSSDSILHR